MSSDGSDRLSQPVLRVLYPFCHKPCVRIDQQRDQTAHHIDGSRDQQRRTPGTPPLNGIAHRDRRDRSSKIRECIHTTGHRPGGVATDIETHRPSRADAKICDAGRGSNQQRCRQRIVRDGGNAQNQTTSNKGSCRNTRTSDSKAISFHPMIGPEAADDACSRPAQKNERCQQAGLIGREATRLAKIRLQPRQIEVQAISKSKIRETDEKQIPAEKRSPCDFVMLLAPKPILPDSS